MKTIGNYRAKTHLSHCLGEVEKGKRFKSAQGRTIVAELGPARCEENGSRPMVGEIEGETFKVPRGAFAPFIKRELNDWGL